MQLPGEVLQTQSIAPRRRELRNFHEVVSAADAQFVTLAAAAAAAAPEAAATAASSVSPNGYSTVKSR